MSFLFRLLKKTITLPVKIVVQEVKGILLTIKIQSA